MHSDGYHRCLQFLIVDLNKSEVGPSNIYFFFSIFFIFFFQKSNFYSKITKNCFTGFPFFHTSVRHSDNILMSFLLSVLRNLRVLGEWPVGLFECFAQNCQSGVKLVCSSRCDAVVGQGGGDS